MAGDGGENKRLPKRAFHYGEREESPVTHLDESVQIQSGLTQAAGKKRRGKENSVVKANPNPNPNPKQQADAAGKMEDAAPCQSAEQAERTVFFDEDSNHIFPVEQFFGNMDAIQDYSQKPTGTKDMSRREYRRRHYYAKEDSEEEDIDVLTVCL